MEFKIKNDVLIPVNTTKQSYLKDNIKGNVFHDTYLDYLYHSYANHYGIEVKPDFTWLRIPIVANGKEGCHGQTESKDFDQGERI
jgi:hypothetical protein